MFTQPISGAAVPHVERQAPPGPPIGPVARDAATYAAPSLPTCVPLVRQADPASASDTPTHLLAQNLPNALWGRIANFLPSNSLGSLNAVSTVTARAAHVGVTTLSLTAVHAIAALDKGRYPRLAHLTLRECTALPVQHLIAILRARCDTEPHPTREGRMELHLYFEQTVRGEQIAGIFDLTLSKLHLRNVYLGTVPVEQLQACRTSVELDRAASHISLDDTTHITAASHLPGLTVAVVWSDIVDLAAARRLAERSLLRYLSCWNGGRDDDGDIDPASAPAVMRILSSSTSIETMSVLAARVDLFSAAALAANPKLRSLSVGYCDADAMETLAQSMTLTSLSMRTLDGDWSLLLAMRTLRHLSLTNLEGSVGRGAAQAIAAKHWDSLHLVAYDGFEPDALKAIAGAPIHRLRIATHADMGNDGTLEALIGNPALTTLDLLVRSLPPQIVRLVENTHLVALTVYAAIQFDQDAIRAAWRNAGRQEEALSFRRSTGLSDHH